MENSRFFCVALTVANILLIILCVCHGKANEQLREDAVEKGFAEYNQSTGKWQWKEKDGE